MQLPKPSGQITQVGASTRRTNVCDAMISHVLCTCACRAISCANKTGLASRPQRLIATSYVVYIQDDAHRCLFNAHNNNNNNNYGFQPGLGASDDSLCVPRRPVLSITMRTSGCQTSVRQQKIIPDLHGLTNNTSTSDLSIHHLLRQAGIRHPDRHHHTT